MTDASTQGIPSTYNKDLQESVEPMLDHCKTVGDSIQIATGVLSTLTIDSAKMLAALSPDMIATDLADYLVRKGVPFRETHHLSGRCVAFAEDNKITMAEMSPEQFAKIDSRFEADVLKCFDYEQSVEFKSAPGGTAKKCVQAQIDGLKAMLQ